MRAVGALSGKTRGTTEVFPARRPLLPAQTADYVWLHWRTRIKGTATREWTGWLATCSGWSSMGRLDPTAKSTRRRRLPAFPPREPQAQASKASSNCAARSTRTRSCRRRAAVRIALSRRGSRCFAHLKRVATIGTRRPIGKQRFLGIEGASVYSQYARNQIAPDMIRPY
jgi:hypothetical protein